MLLVLAQSDIQKYGVFAAMVVVAGMIMASAGMVAKLWRGPLRGWDSPDQSPLLNRFVGLASAFLLVLGFFYASPHTMWIVLLVGGALILISIACGMLYVTKIRKYRRYKEVVAGDGMTKKVPVLAGNELTRWAENAMNVRGLTDQQIFAGTPGNPYEADQVWTPASRLRAHNELMILFVLTLFCGTGALSWLAYAVEVKVTGRSASEILNPSQIPQDGAQKEISGH
jgi:hypothetical protein